MMGKVSVFVISILLIISGILVVVEGSDSNLAEGANEGLESEIRSSGLADSAWPSFGRDRKNTGLSPYDTSHIDGTKIWDFETGDHIRSSPAIGDDGTVYIGSVDNHLYAVDPDGTEMWSFETGDHIRSTPAIGDDGTIYFGSNDKNLYAVAPDGTERWNFTTDGFVQSSPTIGDDGTVYFASHDNHLYALNPDGTKRWSFNPIYDCDHSPAIGDDGTIYFGSGLDEPELFALHPNGTKKWSFDPDFGGTMTSSPTIADDGTIYYGSVDENLYAVNPDGTERWNFKTGGTVYSSPAIGSDGTIYFGSDDKNLYALYPNGTEKWSFETDWYFRSPPAVGSDGTIYVGCYDNNLYALHPNGTEKWSFETGFHIGSSPAIASDGTVYLTSFDDHLYALGEEFKKHDLTVKEPIGNGTVEVEGQNVSGWPYEETYEDGSEVNLKAIAEDGWEFKGWTGIDRSGENITVNMDEDREITAHFGRGSDRVGIGANITAPDDGDEFQKGEEVHIEFDVTNPEDQAIEILLLIEDDDLIVNETWEGEELKTDGSYEGCYTWEPEEEGEYNITVVVNGLYLTVHYDRETVTITVEEGDDIPGFTTALLLSGMAVAIYQKKRRRDMVKDG